MIAVLHGREILGVRYFELIGIGQQQDEQAREWQMHPAGKPANGIVRSLNKSHGFFFQLAVLRTIRRAVSKVRCQSPNEKLLEHTLESHFTKPDQRVLEH